MGFLSRFEGKMEDAVEGAAGGLSHSPISPVQIAKKCEKQMIRSRMVGAGKQYAPTLYTVLVNPDDDERLFSFYPTLAGETETYLRAKAGDQGLYMDGQPLVRFIVDDGLRHGKFDVIAEVVASSIIVQLRQEEMERYGLARPSQQQMAARRGQQAARAPYNEPQPYSDPYAAEAYDDYGAGNDPYDPYAPPAAPVADPYAPASAPVADPYAPASAAAAAYAGNGANDGWPAQGAAGTARLIDLTNNKTFVLNRPRMVAGRSNECDIMIPDINASRRHAELVQQSQGVWEVRDLGSKNGTVVNGNAIYEPITLFEGDRLTMGLTDYKFTMA